MKRRFPALMILLGVALLVFGLMDYDPAESGRDLVFHTPWSHGMSYPLRAKITASLGAVVLAGGLLLRRNPN